MPPPPKAKAKTTRKSSVKGGGSHPLMKFLVPRFDPSRKEEVRLKVTKIKWPPSKGTPPEEIFVSGVAQVRNGIVTFNATDNSGNHVIIVGIHEEKTTYDVGIVNVSSDITTFLIRYNTTHMDDVTISERHVSNIFRPNELGISVEWVRVEIITDSDTSMNYQNTPETKMTDNDGPFVIICHSDGMFSYHIAEKVTWNANDEFDQQYYQIKGVVNGLGESIKCVNDTTPRGMYEFKSLNSNSTNNYHGEILNVIHRNVLSGGKKRAPRKRAAKKTA